MNNRRPKHPVTLEQLKQAIAALADPPREPGRLSRLEAILVAQRDAWRTAFEWRVQLAARHAELEGHVNAHLYDFIAIDREDEEGMTLIREKLL